MPFTGHLIWDVTFFDGISFSGRLTTFTEAAFSAGRLVLTDLVMSDGTVVDMSGPAQWNVMSIVCGSNRVRLPAEATDTPDDATCDTSGRVDEG